MKSNPFRALEDKFSKLGINPYTTIFHHDSGHGWYQFHKDVIKAFGLEDKISQCSFAKGNFVFLEEDCDAPLVFRAARECGFTIDVVGDNYKEESPVRGYPRFN